MRVVLDTNVIVSGSISAGGVPGQIIDAWEQKLFQLLVSQSLLSEYRRALGYEHVRRLHRNNDAQIDEQVSRYSKFGILVNPTETLSVITEDPDDDRILECAITGAATQIISGDPHLINLGSYQGIPILTPREFIHLLHVESAK